MSEPSKAMKRGQAFHRAVLGQDGGNLRPHLSAFNTTGVDTVMTTQAQPSITPMAFTGEALTALIRGGLDVADFTSLTPEQLDDVRAGRARIAGDSSRGFTFGPRPPVTFTDEQIRDLTDGMTTHALGLLEHLSPGGQAEMRRIWEEEPHRRQLFREEPPPSWRTT